MNIESRKKQKWGTSPPGEGASGRVAHVDMKTIQVTRSLGTGEFRNKDVHGKQRKTGREKASLRPHPYRVRRWGGWDGDSSKRPFSSPRAPHPPLSPQRISSSSRLLPASPTSSSPGVLPFST